MLKKLDAKSIVGLGFWDSGFKSMSSNQPLHVPADLRGLKLQVQSSKVVETQMLALGAIPRVIPSSDLVQSLQNNAIDGTENLPTTFYDKKIYLTQKYLTMTNHGYVGYAVVVNKKFWNSLPAEIRIQLSTAINETSNYANQIAWQKNDRDLAAIKKTGKTTVIELSPAEKALWQKTLRPVQTEMEGRIGKKLIESINKEVKSR